MKATNQEGLQERKRNGKLKYLWPCLSFAAAVAIYVVPKAVEKLKLGVTISNALDVLSILIAFTSMLAFLFLQFENHNAKEHGDMVSSANTMKESNTEEHSKITNKLDLLTSEFTPANYSPAGDKPDPAFNAIIRREMESSHCYHFFFSNRARYHTSRLKDYKIDRTSNFDIALPHLEEDKVFRAMAENRFNNEAQHQSGIDTRKLKDDYRKREWEDTFKSFYFMYKLMVTKGLLIKVYVHTEIPFIRFELTTRILAMSFLPMKSKGQYPPSIIYDKTKQELHWEAFYSYSLFIKNTAKDSFDKPEQIIEYLKKHYVKENTEKQLDFDEFLIELDKEFDMIKNEE